MKRFLTVLLGLAMIAAQANGADQFGRKTMIQGAVLDSLSREPEIAAVLQFFRASDSEKPVAFTTTDADGRFAQPLEGEGEYFVLFSNLGRKERKVSFVLEGQPTLDLGEILVQDDTQMLQSASVTAQRILVKMDVDKMTYDVENDVDSKTSTVLDMLRKVPMVTVDGEDNISVNGSSSFQVTVNGKPSPFFSNNPGQIFKMMPASAVKDIQVITNPGVKYDAEGVGGVLNITMATASDGSSVSTDGYNGSVSLRGSNRGLGGSVFYSQQKDKFTLSLNASLNQSNMRDSWSETAREQYTPAGTVSTLTRSEFDLRAPIALANVSASYEIDAQNLISATAGLTSFSSDIAGTTATSIGPLGYGTQMTNSTGYNAISANVDYQHSWADVPSRIFTLSYQFSGTPTSGSTVNRYSGATDVMSLMLTDMQQGSKSLSLDNTVQADFTTPLGEALTLSTGAKFIGRHNSSDSDLSLWDGSGFVLSGAGSTQYDFYNSIGAAYAELGGSFGKLSAKAGVRYEHTWQRAVQNGSDFSTSYGIAVPTASLQYNIGMLSNIGLTYNMRISRPGISYLNPHVDVSDPTVRSYGNPDLDIEKAHNLSLVYNFFTPAFIVNLTGRYTYSGQGISSYSFYDEAGLLNTTYGNIVCSQSAGLNGFVTVMPGKKTRIILNGGTSYNDFSSAQLSQSNSGWSWNALVGAQQTLPLDLRLSANFILMGNTYNLQGWSSGINVGTLGLTRSFLDDRLSVSVNGITNLGKGGLAIEQHSAGKDFCASTVSSVPIRQIALSVSWTFGKQSFSVKKARRGISNDEQLNQTSQAETLSNAGVLGN